MDVTKSNFLAVEREFGELLERSEFVALDAEMTGITLPDLKESCFDSPSKSYSTKRKVAETYGLIQIGLCLFERRTLANNDTDVILARPFNFFVFPSGDIERRATRSLVLEPEAIHFNRHHNMDFQKWIYEGVGYCTASEEARHFQALCDSLSPKPGSSIDCENPEVQPVRERIESWLRDSESAELPLPEVQDRSLQKLVERHIQALQLDVRFFQRNKFWIASRQDRSSQIQKAIEKHLSFVGFRKIYKTLVESKKPIVGHNLLMDLLFLIAHMDGIVPEDIESLQRYAKENFPAIWDTKILASSCGLLPLFESTALQNLFTYFLAEEEKAQKLARTKESDPPFPQVLESPHHIQLSPVPGIEFPLGFERYAEALKKRSERRAQPALAHEAAFDALCTGYVFEQFRKRVTVSMLSKYQNSMVLFRSLYYIHLAKGYQWMPSTHVFRLEYAEEVSDIEAAASLLPLKGKIEWAQSQSAVAYVDPSHSVSDVLAHYQKHRLRIKCTEVLPDSINDNTTPFAPLFDNKPLKPTLPTARSVNNVNVAPQQALFRASPATKPGLQLPSLRVAAQNFLRRWL